MRGVMFRNLVAALSVTLGMTSATLADDTDLLRERVESADSQPMLTVAGTRVALPRAIAEMYARRGFALEWADAAKQEQMLRAIRAASDDGLNPEDYHLAAIERLRSRAATGSSAEERVDLDLLLSDGLARLGQHILYGKVDFSRFDPVWNYRPEHPGLDPPVALQATIDAPDVAAAVERGKPAHAAYTGLKALLARYRAIRQGGGWKAIPAGATLRPGGSDPRVPALRSRLAATGEANPVTAVPERFDDALAAGVAAFQKRHGLAADGVVGARTLEELNVSIDDRIAQIRVNLERARWLLNDIGDEFVIVNIAGFRLYYLAKGQIVWQTDVQVGKPYRSTPVFRSLIRYLVFNPTWTVPPGILKNDILPAQKRDPSYLARKGLKVIDGSGREIDAAAIDWEKTSARSFPYRIRQDPGPENSLGRVKFMFPNEHSVYLHDTPHRELFERDERAFSSGCIRVADPLKLAELLLRGNEGWDRAAIDAAIAAGKLKSVTLAQPVPVLLAYWTAWDDAGSAQFRRDLYGRDGKVLKALDAPFAPPR